MARSAINHSGLFSETKRHLSPSLIFSLIFESLNILFFVSSHVKVLLLFGFNHFKKWFSLDLAFQLDKKIIQPNY